MAPKGVSTWRRPYTSIYNDNYKYGTGLYSDTLSDIEKRYSDSLSRTQLRSDRPDLAFSTFLGSSLASSPTPGGADTSAPTRSSLSPIPEAFKGSTFESRLSAALHTAYDDDGEVARHHATPDRGGAKSTTPQDTKQRPKSLYDDAAFWTLPKKEGHSVEFEMDSLKKRKTASPTTPTNGPSSASWREKSRDLQGQVDQLERSLSESSGRLKGELSTLKGRCHGQLAELAHSADQSDQQAQELQKTVRKQAHQLADLQSAYDEAQRSLQSALEEMDTWHGRCKALKKDMDRLRDEVEQATQRSSSVNKA